MSKINDTLGQLSKTSKDSTCSLQATLSKASSSEKAAYIPQLGDYVIYPKRGLLQVQSFETKEYSGMKIELVSATLKSGVMNDNSRIEFPRNKISELGVRPLSSARTILDGFEKMISHPKSAKGTWGKQKQEFDKKNASGDFIQICEVLRDVSAKETFTGNELQQVSMGYIAPEISIVKGISLDKANAVILEALDTKRIPSIVADLSSKKAPTKATSAKTVKFDDIVGKKRICRAAG